MDINVKFIRRFQTAFSISSFIVVFLLCWYKTGFDLTNIQLSYFGVFKDPIISNIWNICIEVVSISIFINVHFYLKNNNRIIHRKKFYLLFFIVSLVLFLSGAINMHYKLHTILAVIYFFIYPLAIFIFSFVNKKSLQYNEWKVNLFFSLFLVVVPLLTINAFKGLAISEISHSAIVLLWNVWILF